MKTSAAIAARENALAVLAVPYVVTTAKVMWEIYSLVYEAEIDATKQDIAIHIAEKLNVSPEKVLKVMEVMMSCTSVVQMLKNMGRKGFKLLLEKGMAHAIKNGVNNLDDFLGSISKNIQKSASKVSGGRPPSHESAKPPKAPGKGGKSSKKSYNDGKIQNGHSGLNPAQQSNLKRFESKIPQNSTPVKVRDLPDGGKAFQADSPSRNIPGSFARYEKQIDKNGRTLQYTKTTYDASGNIVHVAPKYPEGPKIRTGDLK